MSGANEVHEDNGPEPMKIYDVIIIGSGPAGYTAANIHLSCKAQHVGDFRITSWGPINDYQRG